MNELKPCPFCGGESLLRDLYIKGVANTKHYIRECHHCKATFAHWFRSIKRANEAWNRRVILDGCKNELIVRCKDCKHYNTIGCSKGFGWCENIDRGTSDNFYCANGKQLNKEVDGLCNKAMNLIKEEE